jgi:hypothetical protein
MLTPIDVSRAVKLPAKFKYYREGVLYYETGLGDVFGVPLDDLGKATVNAEEKGILLMRYMRLHNEAIKNAKSD